MEQKLGSGLMHFVMFLSGSTVLGVLAHALQSFPTPRNVYGQWFLGVLQYAVGQRERAQNTMAGMDTVTHYALPKETR